MALAIYTNSSIPRIYGRFEQSKFVTHILYKFRTYRIMKQNPDELAASDNIFALFVLANYYVNKTRGNLQKRLEFKEKMIELAEERKISSDKLTRFFLFVDNVMLPPLNLQEEFNNYLFSKYKIQSKMASVLDQRLEYWKEIFASSRYDEYRAWFEERERQDARKEGRQEARQEALEELREYNKKTVLKLHNELQWTAAKIAAILELPIIDIEKYIAENQGK